MIENLLFGVLASTVTELVTYLNLKLQNTLLKGDAAWLLALAIAIIAAVGREILMPGFNVGDLTTWTNLTRTFFEVWGASQVYFYFVVQKLGMDFEAPTTTAVRGV